MMNKYILLAILNVFFIFSSASAQKPELTITLNEPFFDALLDSVFKNFDAHEFSIAASSDKVKRPANSSAFASTSTCKETIQILRENNGVRTTVRFRDSKIYAPLAFTGNYSPPFVGCVAFSGYAETNIALEFDQNSQRLIARAKVLNIALNGTGGVGGGVVAKLVQSSIDKKINPIEIIRMDKLSFLIPVQNGASLRMRATGIRHEIENGALKINIAYEFVKV
jgi:hypothetical protein